MAAARTRARRRGAPDLSRIARRRDLHSRLALELALRDLALAAGYAARPRASSSTARASAGSASAA
jgi:hypothetical protein